jgi:hypothetical protein
MMTEQRLVLFITNFSQHNKKPQLLHTGWQLTVLRYNEG